MKSDSRQDVRRAGNISAITWDEEEGEGEGEGGTDKNVRVLKYDDDGDDEDVPVTKKVKLGTVSATARPLPKASSSPIKPPEKDPGLYMTYCTYIHIDT